MSLESLLSRLWYSEKTPTYLLKSLSLPFQLLTQLRRYGYQWRLFKRHSFNVPIIVVGNLSVGGTGKTPLVLWLAHFLLEQGLRPGIISGGYGGLAQNYPLRVTSVHSPAEVGDEAAMMLKQCSVPLVIAPKRCQAARYLQEETDCNVIISDDGLQHYALMRDVEILVIDGQRRLGNGLCLPVGPLREAPGRYYQVDFIINNGQQHPGEFTMQLEPGTLVCLADPKRKMPIAQLSGMKIHAACGIGHPERFFSLLRSLGAEVIAHKFPDHYAFQASDLLFDDDLPVLMTEKDGVKYQPYALSRHFVLPVKAKLPPAFAEKLLGRIAPKIQTSSHLQT